MPRSRTCQEDGDESDCFVEPESGIVATPGAVGKLPPLLKVPLQMFSTSPLDGAATTLVAATAPMVRQKAHRYFGSYLNPVGALGNSSDLSSDAGKVREL